MLKIIKILGVFSFLVFFVFSANISANSQPDQKLFGRQWKLTKINDEQVEMDISFIKFDRTKKSIKGNGGCNNFGGSMTIKGNKIKISKALVTMMYCQGVQQIEVKFFDNLTKITNYKIIDRKLYLKAGNKILLEFEAKK